MDAKDLRSVGDSIETLVRDFGALADPHLRAKAETLVRLLMELYGAGLERILEIVDEEQTAAELFERFSADDLVSSLLVLHGLHPFDLETRIERALERARPTLGANGVGLIEVREGVVRLRAEGPSATPALRRVIERVVQQAAPEVTGVEVEGVVEPAPRLLQIELGGTAQRPAETAVPTHESVQGARG